MLQALNVLNRHPSIFGTFDSAFAFNISNFRMYAFYLHPDIVQVIDSKSKIYSFIINTLHS